MTPLLRPQARHVGRELFRFDDVESTQSVAQTIPPGSAVLAGHQSAGKGQYGRTWVSRPGDAVLLSVVLDPPAELRRAVVLTAWAAVAAGEAVRRLTGITPRIKWPNDLQLNGRKVCGILTEQGRTVVCGIGLNVNQSVDDWAEAGLPEATSFFVETYSRFDIANVAEEVLGALDDQYDRLVLGGYAELEADWVRRSDLLGREVAVEAADGQTVTGRLTGMSFAGLRLVTSAGPGRMFLPEHVRQLRPV